MQQSPLELIIIADFTITSYYTFVGQSGKIIMSLVIVTGGATGIGAATVRKFASEGFNVAFLDINTRDGKNLESESYSGSLIFLETDVSSKLAVEKSVNSAIEMFGQPVVLFANAGVFRPTSIFELSEDDVNFMIDINLKGILYSVAAVAGYMRDAKKGAIVLMSSEQAFVGKNGCLVYGATKGAIAQMTKGLSVELSPYGVRVNAVCPATVRTPLTDRVFQQVAENNFNGDLEAVWAAESMSYPIGRVAEPNEIAEVVFFLTQQTSSFMTGSLVTVDGGLTSQATLIS